MNFLLETVRLTKKYGSFLALDGVSFSVRQGERVALIGANGAGKSTIFNLLLGFLPPEQGEARLFGMPSRPLPAAAKARLAYLSEETALPPWSTPRGLMELFAGIYPRWNNGLMERLAGEWKISLDKSCKTMSKGQRRLAETALFLSTTPELLLLDEPFDGLDALMRLTVIKTILTLNAEQGLTVFFSSHIVSEAPRLSERVIVLKKGRIVMDTPLSALENTLEESFLRLHENP